MLTKTKDCKCRHNSERDRKNLNLFPSPPKNNKQIFGIARLTKIICASVFALPVLSAAESNDYVTADLVTNIITFHRGIQSPNPGKWSIIFSGDRWTVDSFSTIVVEHRELDLEDIPTISDHPNYAIVGASNSGEASGNERLLFDIPNAKLVIKVNHQKDKDNKNGLALIGVLGKVEAKEIEIGLNSNNSSALLVRPNQTKETAFSVKADSLVVDSDGFNNFGINAAPAVSATKDPSSINFKTTEINMTRGGTAVLAGAESAHEYSGVRSIAANLGNTTILLVKGDDGKISDKNVGLYAASAGQINAENFTFVSDITNAAALKAVAFDDSEKASVSVSGIVNINADRTIPNGLAAYAGRNGTVNIELKSGRIVGDAEAHENGRIQIKLESGSFVGNVLAEGSSMVDLHAQGPKTTIYSQITVAGNSRANLTLADGAAWNVNGHSHVSSLTVSGKNNYVNLTHKESSEPKKNTVVIDQLAGSAEDSLIFVLHSNLGASANNSVVINAVGDVTAHTLYIPSSGAEGKKQVGDTLIYVPQGVEIALNSTYHPDNNFNPAIKPKKRVLVDQGLYVYELVKKESVALPVEGAAAPADNASSGYDGFYLKRVGGEEDSDQTTDGSGSSIFSPTVNAVLAMAGMGGQNAMYHNQLSDLRKRLGEVRGMTESNGLWVSASGQRDRFDGFASNGVKQNAYRFNLGLDHKIGSWLIGTNFKYLHGTQKTSNSNSHARGKVNSAGANIYGTWIAENGMYTDIVASFDHYHQKITTSMLDGRGVSGKVNNFGLGLSAEVGKKFHLTKDFFVEPQAQLAYYWIKGKDFSMSNGMKVEQDDFNSLVGRLGVVAGKDFKDAEGNTKGQIFVKGGVKQQFAGKQKLRANSVQFKDELKGTSGYYGLGFEANSNKKVSFYGHVERENGKHYTKEVEVMLGLRYKF